MKKNKNISDTRCIRNPDTLKSYYEAMLGHWPVSMEKLFIPTSLGRTLCIKSGDKKNPPMILIHGSLSNSATWMADIKKLNKKY